MIKRWNKYHYQNAKISDFMKIEGVGTAMIFEYPFNDLIIEYPSICLVYSQQVFGAYLSSSWEERNDGTRKKYFGSGECFLFTMEPKEVLYPWVGIADENPKQLEAAKQMFMRATEKELAIGGG